MSSKLQFAAYNFKDYTPTPDPPYNAGLYTGDPCKQGAGWCPVPIKADASAYMEMLASANPPPGAMQQPVSATRPGNNYYEPPNYTTVEGFIRCSAKNK